MTETKRRAQSGSKGVRKSSQVRGDAGQWVQTVSEGVTDSSLLCWATLFHYRIGQLKYQLKWPYPSEILHYYYLNFLTYIGL